jgi:hypothetical protein
MWHNFVAFRHPKCHTAIDLGFGSRGATVVPAALFQKLDMCSAADVIKARPNVDSIVVGWETRQKFLLERSFSFRFSSPKNHEIHGILIQE